MAFGNCLDSSAVERALAEVEGLSDPLAVASRLRESLPTPLARAAAGLHDLRSRAKGSALDRDLRFLTSKGLQQATAGAVATYRAQRIWELAPDSLIWDGTAGIGADSLALLRRGLSVITSDLDNETLACAASNLAHLSTAGWVLRADAATPPCRVDIVLLDPDRRPQGPREGHPERWSPPMSTCLDLARGNKGACIKLPPGMDPAQLEGLAETPHGLQWISLGGQLRELALWTGCLAGDLEGQREALVLGPEGPLGSFRGEPEELQPLDPGQVQAVKWLAEPDPAVIRAGLVGPLALEQGMRPLGPRLAYLGGDHEPSSPMLRSWRVLETSALDPKRVRAMLRRHDVGPLTVKKRGHPDDAQTLARRFKGPGKRHGLLAVARLEKGHGALLLEIPGEC
jgi:hypothetical protein